MDENIEARASEALEELRAENITHLYCGHCGRIEDVQEVNLIEAVRHLCVTCRAEILSWI